MKKGLLFFSLIFLIACELFARVTITGQVKNATGESFPRASVAVNVTKLGTETKVDGKYSIIVPPNTTPVFSFIGMLKEEKPNHRCCHDGKYHNIKRRCGSRL